MEGKSNTPSEWEWENAAIYGSSAIEMGRDLAGNGSTYSLADVGFSSSSKNSISSYVCPLSKHGTRNLEGIDDGFTLKSGDFQIPSPSIGLKLGRRSYFEEKGMSFSVMPTSSSSLQSTKRARASYQNTQVPRCQVEGCNLDLVSAKDYHRRHRICESHSKSPKVIVAGLERRFHDLSEFDERKRSCRRRLSNHNARRRRTMPRPEAIQFVSAPISSSLYGALLNSAKD
ncbi:hypothetical protein LguiA_025648 [Lonicera macranthoides]